MRCWLLTAHVSYLQAGGQVVPVALNQKTESPSRAGTWFSSAGMALGLLLAISTIVVYRPVDRYPFIHTDDPDYVTENVHVRSGLSWNTFRWAFTTKEAANWHPLTWLSHSLDCQLFGLNSARHHDVNITLHALNAALLFWVLAKATGFPGRSFMVAALFAFHPLNVESVAWIAERKTLLSMLFFLLALAAYGWYARRPRIGPYVVVTLFYALALMAKPQAITFPCVLLLWDYWPLRRMFAEAAEPSLKPEGTPVIPPRGFAWLVLEKLPLLALSAVSAKLTIAAQFGFHAETWFPKSVRAETAIVSYARYVSKAVWPSKLAFLYPHPLSLLPWSQVVPAVLLLVIITGFTAFYWRRRYLTVGWLWFLGTLVPMIGVIQVGEQAMADRYAYLPFIGLFIMFCWAAADVAAEYRLPALWKVGIGVAVLVPLIIVTHRQIGIWSDDETLWTHTLQVTNGNWGAEDALGSELWRQGRMDEAVPHFARAVEVLPYDYTANVDLGTYEALHGNSAEAVERFKKVVRLDNILPRQRAVAFNSLGQAYLQLKDYQNAGQSFALAVRVNPGYYGAWIGLGVALQKAGKPDLAVNAYSRAIQIQPVDWVYLLLARALEQNGQTEKARQATQQAALLSRNFGQTTRTADQILGH
jgi:Flp pilus assembly protein TadD